MSFDSFASTSVIVWRGWFENLIPCTADAERKRQKHVAANSNLQILQYTNMSKKRQPKTLYVSMKLLAAYFI